MEAYGHETEITEIRRYGSYIVRFSALSERWCVYEGIVIVYQADEFSDAVKQAIELSGYNEPAEDMFLPIPPVPTDLSRLTLAPTVTADIADLSGGVPSMDMGSGSD